MATFLSRTVCAVLTTVALQTGATTVTISDNLWHAFDVDNFTATSGGFEWIDVTDGSLLNFAFTLTNSAILRIVDGGLSGDTFSVLSGGSPLLSTSPAVNIPTNLPLPPTQAGFDAAWADSNYSRGSTVLGPGTYSISGLLQTSATDINGMQTTATVGAIMLAPVPEPTNALMLLAGIGVVWWRVRSRSRA